MKVINAIAAALMLAGALAAPAAQAGAIRDAALFTDNTLVANDDSSTAAVSLGFAINFFGLNTSQAFVNNNGNITFGGALSTFTPFGLISTNTPILAAFFADVDTRGNGSGLTQYGQDLIGGHKVFGVNWINVGYYPTSTNKLNSFQLIMTDRSDISAGDFDFEFNYDSIVWETGGASNGTNGLGGDSARVGWSNGSTNSFELAGSAVNGALLNGGVNALVGSSLNSNVAGRYVFNVRNGTVQNGTVPEPASLLLVGVALCGLGLARRQRNKA